MNFQALNMFLSEENIKRHIEHFKTLKHKLSILEKSDDRIISATIDNIKKMRIDRELRREIVELKVMVHSHECFFNSFALRQRISPGDRLRAEKILHEIYLRGKEMNGGFIYLFNDKGIIRISDDYRDVNPMLCIDLYEHCYFLDYGFIKERFLKNALPYLDLGRLLDISRDKGYN